MRKLMLAALALLAIPATQASIIMTPLQLGASPPDPDNGATVTFTVAPQDQANATGYAGRTVDVVAFDRNGTGSWPVATITLSGKATAEFTWTLPAAVDDKNLDIRVLDGDEHPAAFAKLSVGDAEPMFEILAASGEPADPDTPTDDSQGNLDDGSGAVPDGAEADDTGSDGKDSPGPAVLVTLGLVALAALVLRRR